ncbi:MAG: hypothetical protein ABSE40_19225 [Candidatus Sulfotelmatobacter sp.]|jgi:hypothetical protein
MRTPRLFAVLLGLATVHPCTAQVMDASRYRDYMSGPDAATERWQKQISSIDVGKMKVGYAKGNLIENFCRVTLTDLKSLRSYIDAQHQLEAYSTALDDRLRKTDPNNPKLAEALRRARYEESLSIDIHIEEAMGDAYLDLTNLLDALPSDDEGLFLQGSITPVMTELQERQLELRSHIHDYSDKLQSKAQDCSR